MWVRRPDVRPRRSLASCTGVDINPHAIDAARRRAEEAGLGPRVRFDVIDAGERLPFEDCQFDAVLSNDSINHLPDRKTVIADWHRVVRPGGVVLFTDPVVVTGPLTSDEVRRRSSIGYFVFTPQGYNARILEETGFETLEVRDVTSPVAEVSYRWRQARERRHAELAAIEGEDQFAAFQDFLSAVNTLASEGRLSRHRYLARRRH